MPNPKCDHDYVYLRQDRDNIGYDRNPVWLVRDVYHCRRCLHYRRVDVERRTPRSDGGEHVEKLICP